MNDVLLNWRKIGKFLSDRNKASGGRPYTHDEIRKMANATGQTYRAMIYFMSSTGVRLGALEELKVGDLVPIPEENLYQVTVYRGDKYEYKTFTTPETRQFLDEYLDKRNRDGEQITEDSPLFRVEYDPKEVNKDVRALDRFTIKGQLVRIRLLAGVVPPKRRVQRGSKERYHKVHVSNGFRKFAYNRMDESGISKQVLECLIGHKQGLDVGGKNYFEPSDSRLLEEFKKAINKLTINEENRLKEKLDTVEKQQQAEINELRIGYENSIARIREMQQGLESYQKRLKQEQNKRIEDIERKSWDEAFRALTGAMAKTFKVDKKSAQEVEQELLKMYEGLDLPWKPIKEQKKEGRLK